MTDEVVLTPFPKLPGYFKSNIPCKSIPELVINGLYYSSNTGRVLKCIYFIKNNICFLDILEEKLIIYNLPNEILYRKNPGFGRRPGIGLMPLIPMEISKHVDEEYGHLFS